MRKLLFVCMMALACAASAAEVAGVKLPDTMKLGNADLMLNGGGLRVKVFFKVYVAALYLPEKKGAAADVLALKGPKRMHIVTRRDLGAEDFANALVESMHANMSEAEAAAMKPRIDQFRKTILDVKETKEGTVVELDYLPESGTRLSLNGQQRGADIPGEDFYRALLRIWLGDKPAQDDLKNALLGKSAS